MRETKVIYDPTGERLEEVLKEAVRDHKPTERPGVGLAFVHYSSTFGGYFAEIFLDPKAFGKRIYNGFRRISRGKQNV